MKTIDDLTEFFKIDRNQFLKAVAYSADGEIVIAFINGAYDVNETKLINHLGVVGLDVADPTVLSDKGIVPGYISPAVAKISGIKVVFDRTVLTGAVYVVGGDKEDYHRKGAVVGRDFEVGEVHDIATIREGDPCPKCKKGKIGLRRGIELGHTFQLGTKYSESMGLKYLGEDGKEELVVMGCYGIGVERAMASIIEAHHDENGMLWPVSVAPFDVMVLPLGSDDDILNKALEISEAIGSDLDVLIDDREETAGVKFNDSDLVGIPIRVVVSKKLIAKGEVELKVRRSGEVVVVSESKAVETAKSLLKKLGDMEEKSFNSGVAVS
jgi:prolyl-tRNA synthetase